MKKLELLNYEYPIYPPSILLIGDDPSRALKLKRKLERHGLRVYQANVSSDELAKARQKYFELIVFNIKRLDAKSCEVCRKIKADPELAEIPMVILTTLNLSQEILKLLNVGTSVSYLSGDNSAEEKLIRIIEQRHYMTSRYM